MNDEEAKTLTGCENPQDAIAALREWGCRGVVITTHQGAEAFLDDQSMSSETLEVGSVAQTVGAGDRFAGVLVAAWTATGYSMAQAMDLGQAAAAVHVVQLPSLTSLAELDEWATLQPKVAASPSDGCHRFGSLVPCVVSSPPA